MVCVQEGCSAPKSGKSKYCKAHKVEARKRWKEMVANKGNEREDRNAGHKALFAKADAAGLAAADACTPRPMVVRGYESTPVMGGVCGFAWVVVRPGNSSFAIWAKKNMDASAAYGGGTTVKWVGEHGQSMAKKEAHARAFAKVLAEAGLKAAAQSRMD